MATPFSMSHSGQYVVTAVVTGVILAVICVSYTTPQHWVTTFGSSLTSNTPHGAVLTMRTPQLAKQHTRLPFPGSPVSSKPYSISMASTSSTRDHVPQPSSTALFATGFFFTFGAALAMYSGHRRRVNKPLMDMECNFQSISHRAMTPCYATAEDTTAENKSFKPRDSYRPETFQQIVEDASAAVLRALDAGQRLLQVDYPALPTSDGWSSEGNMWNDANFLQAIAAAQYLHKQKGLKVHLVVPDNVELSRVARQFATQLKSKANVTVGSLTGPPQNVAAAAWQQVSLLFGAMGSVGEDVNKSAEEGEKTADLFLVLGASTVELPAVEEFVENKVTGRPVVLWNLELDTLRADLGLPGFPSKDLQYRFLCRFLSVFYLRPRDYTKTTSEAPFIFNYSGALFREFPGPWQVMFKQSSGKLVCVAEQRRRYALFQFKQELLKAVGQAEEEGSAMEFARSGYKTSTWFEEDNNLEESKAWRL